MDKTFSPWELRHNQFALHCIDYIDAWLDATKAWPPHWDKNGDPFVPPTPTVFRGAKKYALGLRLPYGYLVRW